MTARQQETGSHMRKIAFIGAMLLALSACNTIGGVGQDISAGADTVADMF
jgi:predicted small secreted protein